jgi:fatty-acyl-CoA synthase
MNQPPRAKASRSALDAWVRALASRRLMEAGTPSTLLSVIGANASTSGDRIALMDDNGQLSYRELIDRSGSYGQWALGQGIQVGGTVGLLMRNCPEYVAVWLGISHVGCSVALINTNLEGDSLAHSIRAAGLTHVIVAASLLDAVRAVAEQLSPDIRIWVHGQGAAFDLPRIDIDRQGRETAAAVVAGVPLPAKSARALLIYTSGTTGLPKAANVSHARILEWSYWFAAMMDAGPEDRLYDCLPMYHSTGGVVAIGSMLVSGGSVLIRDRFSARRFWDDVVSGDCTIFQYIGELCRYLVQSAPHPLETAHRLRLACGNGLRGDLWEPVQQRFRIPRILEFYASTEGNVSLYNCEGKPGAIGRIPPFLAHRFPVELVRSDIDTGELLRDTAGFCVRCETDEAGEAISPILAAGESPTHHFDGYTDPVASDRKVARNAFVAGDRWFRTGDLMRKDKAGYFYFVDRIGDTFRWKGENVATDEVATVVAACPGVTQAAVYGVEIPGAEGRAGMAAITVDDRFDFTVLGEHLRASLPEYAAFVRDPVWFYDRRDQAFFAYDEALEQLIASGGIRL